MLNANNIPNTLKLLSIDPGLNNTGIAIFTLKANEGLCIDQIEAFTLNTSRLVDMTDLNQEEQKEQLIKRYALKKAFKHVLQDTNPDVVVSESPFFNQKTASSFSILTEVISSLFDEAVSYNPNLSISMISPLEVKKNLGVAGKIGKEVIQEAVSKIPEITSVLINDLSTLDQHSIDAIAVGWRWISDRKKIFGEQHERPDTKE